MFTNNVKSALKRAAIRWDRRSPKRSKSTRHTSPSPPRYAAFTRRSTVYITLQTALSSATQQPTAERSPSHRERATRRGRPHSDEAASFLLPSAGAPSNKITRFGRGRAARGSRAIGRDCPRVAAATLGLTSGGRASVQPRSLPACPPRLRSLRNPESTVERKPHVTTSTNQPSVQCHVTALFSDDYMRGERCLVAQKPVDDWSSLCVASFPLSARRQSVYARPMAEAEESREEESTSANQTFLFFYYPHPLNLSHAVFATPRLTRTDVDRRPDEADCTRTPGTA